VVTQAGGVDGYYVEPNFPGFQVKFGLIVADCVGEGAGFRLGNAFFGEKTDVGPVFDFDKDQDLAVESDDVQLSTASFPVSGDNRISLLSQVRRRLVFCAMA